MSGGEYGGMSGVIPERTVYAMRHGQKEFGSDDPPLTEKGREQVIEAAIRHLIGINFGITYCGTRIRHFESSIIAKAKLGLFVISLKLPNFRSQTR